uniref:Uncharacterized protein n=1 Tax=Romanomermis culicivorax TaxID=13658 RepID=A0A915IW03_ROMCU
MRRLLFVRHGQRLDRYFSDAYPKVKEWTANFVPTVLTSTLHFPDAHLYAFSSPKNRCFSSSGSYVQVNIETPLHLPNRGRIELYADDPPLTVGGEMSAQLLGNKLAASQIRVTCAYSSPALRCVQTSYRVLQGQLGAMAPKNLAAQAKLASQADFFGGSVGPIKIDGGLYEFGSATTGGLAFAEPKFLYDKASTSTILLVSHASTILTFVRELIQKPTSEETLDQLINIPPSLTTILLEELENGKWVLPVVQPFPSFESRCKSSFSQKWLEKTQYENLWD